MLHQSWLPQSLPPARALSATSMQAASRSTRERLCPPGMTSTVGQVRSHARTPVRLRAVRFRPYCRNLLVGELLRDGLEVTRPERDRGNEGVNCRRCDAPRQSLHQHIDIAQTVRTFCGSDRRHGETCHGIVGPRSRQGRWPHQAPETRLGPERGPNGRVESQLMRVSSTDVLRLPAGSPRCHRLPRV